MDIASASIAAFLAAASFVVLLSIVLARDTVAVDDRLKTLSIGGKFEFKGRANLVKQLSGARFDFLLPLGEEARRRFEQQLVQGGLYNSKSKVCFYVSKLVLLAIPILLGLAANGLGVLTVREALCIGGVAGVMGTVIPTIWLDARFRKRQTNIRRALPDALDILIVCVKGGLSLPGAIARISRELHTAHRLLAAEMLIVQREIQMGHSTAEAMTRLADRFDLEELRSLAGVIAQTERFGANVTKALRAHRDALRTKRNQRAEEMARKAPVQLIFPTILCILPALFVVLAGPAVIKILDILRLFVTAGRSM